jgi:hypothetical protein
MATTRKEPSRITAKMIAKAIGLAATKNIREISEQIGLTYPQTRDLLHRNHVKIKRGRRQGSGVGLQIQGGKKLDRRVSRQLRMIKAGRCTTCGKPNDSESLYHCKACLKRRNENKKR